MKRVSVVLVALLLLLTSRACAKGVIGQHARVVNCKEFISLRYEPSSSAQVMQRLPLGSEAIYLSSAENGFAKIGTENDWGYVREQYLSLSPLPVGKSVLSSLSEKEYYNINVFLSNFTEADLGWINCCFDLSDQREMVEFCVNHIWFNEQEKLEWLEDVDGYNVRLNDRYVADVALKYFGCTPKTLEATFIDHIGDHYYWMETGGHVASGFAIVTDLIYLSEDSYLAYFDTYGSCMGWNNDCCRYSLSEAQAEFGARNTHGSALLRIGDLSEYSSFYLEEYAWEH